LLLIPIWIAYVRFDKSNFQEDGAIKLHINRVIRALLGLQIGTPSPSQNDGIAEDSAMIAAVYETHLSMEKMLAALAELRGDDVGQTAV
jgi:hypothetical protein